jgi:hypothetical protein
MIHEVDDAIRAYLRAEALPGTDVDIVFDAPNTDWASRRTGPTINIYLYDIRENLARRTVGERRIYNDDGFVRERTKPPRFFKLSYLVTAWTQRPEDEHRLLSIVLSCLVQDDVLPAAYLPERLASLKEDLLISIALPPPDDRSVSDVWTALGGELKPSLDFMVTVPLIPGRPAVAGPPVLEVPRIGFAGAGGQDETVGGAGEDDDPAEEDGVAAGAKGKGKGGGRGKGSGEGAAAGRGGRQVMVRRFSRPAGAGGAGGEADRPAEEPSTGAEETIGAGVEPNPGRVFRIYEK